jgi:hypothetical protein
LTDKDLRSQRESAAPPWRIISGDVDDLSRGVSAEEPLEILPAFLSGGGRAADAIFAFDWSRSPLGSMDQWPQSLKTALSMMLSSSFPKAQN